MTTPLNLLVVDGKTVVKTASLPQAAKGQPVHIKAIDGGKYLLSSGENHTAPDHIVVKRVGKDLQVFTQDGDDTPEIIIDGFYDHQGELSGMTADGTYHTYVNQDGSDRDAFLLLDDSGASTLILGSDSTAGLTGLAAAGGLTSGMIALGALAALAALTGIAIAAHNGGGHHHDNNGVAAPNVPGATSASDNVGSVQGKIAQHGVTDDARPVLNGQGTPASVINVYDNGSLIGSTVVAADGSWAFQPGSPLAEGPHDISFSETNSAGAESAKSAPVSFTVDLTPPVAAEVITVTDGKDQDLSHGGLTNNGDVEMSGKDATPGDVVKMYDGDTLIGSTVVDADGNWTVPGTIVGDGKHDLSVGITDPAGNEGPRSPAVPVDLDTTAPAMPAPTLTDGNGLDLTHGGTTTNGDLDMSGTGGTPGDVVKAYDGSTLIGSAVVGADGSWTIPGAISGDGEHDLSASYTDPAGNESAKSAPIAVDLDTTAPDAPTPTLADSNGLDLTHGGVTNDGSLEMSGTGANPGDVVKLYDGDDLIGSAVVDAGGNWTVPGAISGDGPHPISASLTDPVGNESAKSTPIAVDLDTVAPAAPTIDDLADSHGLDLSTGGLTNDGSLDMSGSGATPGDVVKLYDGDDLIGSAVVDAGGNWTVPGAISGDGPHDISASLTDPAGNESAKSAPVVVDLDTTAPDAPTPTLEDSNGLDLTTGGLTNDGSLEMSGTGATPGDVVKLYDGDDLIGSAVVDAGGNWTVPGAISGDGPHPISATVTDPVGNESARSAPIAVELDTTAPGAPTPTLADANGLDLTAGGLTNNGNLDMSGTGGNPGDVVKLYDGANLIGSAVVDAGGNWTVPGAISGDGPHPISASYTDPAGNEGAKSAPIAVDLDTTAPATPALSLEDGNGLDLTAGGLTNNGNLDMSGTGANPGDVVKLYDGDALIGSAVVDASGNWTVPGAISGDGTHPISATATDPAGNESAKSTPIAVELDTTAPDAPTPTLEDSNGLDLTTGGLTNDGNLEMSGTGANPGDVVKLYDGDDLIGSAVVDAGGNWTVPGAISGDGPHPISATVTDPVGNESARSAPIAVELDTTAPDAPTPTLEDGNGLDLTAGGLTNNGNLDMSGTGGNPGDVVKLYDGANLIGSAVVDAGGNWTVPGAISGDGPHPISASYTDPAGNEGAKSAPIAVDLDTTAPATPALSLEDGNGLDLTAGGLTNNGNLDMSGTGANPGDVVKLYDGDALIGSAVVDAGGNWTVPGAISGDGTHDISATATDAAGNESAKSAAIPVDLDMSVAAPTFTLTDNAPTLTGAPGSAEPGALVTLYDGTTAVGSVTAGPDGSWAIKPTTDLTVSAIHDFTATQVDLAGNVSEHSPTTDFKVDVQTSSLAGDDSGGWTVDPAYASYHTADDTGIRIDIPGTIPAGEVMYANVQVEAGHTYKFSFAGGAVGSSGTISGAFTFTIDGVSYNSWGNGMGGTFTATETTTIRVAVIAEPDVALNGYMVLRGFNTADLGEIDSVASISTQDVSSQTDEHTAYLTDDSTNTLNHNVDNTAHAQHDASVANTTAQPEDSAATTTAQPEDNAANTATQQTESAPATTVQHDDGANHFQLSGNELKMIDTGAVIDLSNVAQQHQGEEIHSLSLEGHGNNVLNVNINDVLALGSEDLFQQDGNKQLMIKGDAGDTVNLESVNGDKSPEQWNAQGQVSHDGTTFNVYQNVDHDVEVLIQQGIQTHVQ
ncbi:Ig-like domain-containing protein [Pantoea agglomerans]